ncbi:MAG TPA: hypothetical protein PKU69_00095 [Bacillota bacterium]|nr:hypothetical protein [Bacillota bacterium]HPJ23867.1 hypothetical protein [Bacillota bacterium]
MASIISKVTELDKQMRQKVKELEEEKAKLPIFLRQQRKDLSAKYEAEAKQQIEARKQKIETDLKDAKNSAEKDLKEAMKEIQDIYQKNKDEWIESIYQQCISDFVEE